MSNSKIEYAEWITLFFGAVITWLVYKKTQEKAVIGDGRLSRKFAWRSESLNIADICAVKYHYHAVIGFVAAWEFVAADGKSIRLESNAKGLDSIFKELENRLPGFKLDEFEQQLRAGGVAGSLTIWTRSPAQAITKDHLAGE